MASSSLKVSVHLLLALLVAVQLVDSYHHPLHCPKWKNNCLQYEQNCQNHTSHTNIWKSCHELVSNVSESERPPSGIYSLQRNGPFSNQQAFCDTQSAGGGWTVILRRMNNLTNFDRTFQEYTDGFGNLSSNFWYGLKAMHELTYVGMWELRVDLVDTEKNYSHHVHYGMFSVEMPDYKLMLGDFKDWPESTANDSLSEFSGEFFSARVGKNHSNDCSESNKAGWWYVDNCKGSRGAILTGEYKTPSMGWYSYNEFSYHTYDRIEMKIRPNKL